MFNDRDLGIIGAGALAAVLCLFMPFSFVGKVVVGFVVLILFMVAALLRLGRTSGLPDPGRLQVYVSATATPAGSRVSEVLAAVLGEARRDAAPARERRSEVA